MSDATKQFDARDAFVYVDTYRNGILKTAEILGEEKEKLDKQYWASNAADTRLVAELRGVEHALNYVVKGEEPGRVVLGEGSTEQQQEEGGGGELSECRERLQRSNSERALLEKKVGQLKNQGQELHTEVIRSRQQAQIFQRRLAQSNSTFVVVVASMFLVILVQLYLLWSH